MSLKLGSSPGEGRDYCTTTVGFQAPAVNKTFCQGTFALSALGERDRVPVVLPGGAHRAGQLGDVAPTLPHAVPLHLGKQISPCCCSLFHLCPARFSHCSPSCSLSKAGTPACFGRDAQSFTTPPWAMRSKDLLSSDNCFFFHPPAHSSPHCLHSCLPCSEGLTHPLPSAAQQNHALWLNTVFFKSLTIFIPFF